MLYFLASLKNLFALLGLISLFLAALIRFFLPQLDTSITGLLLLTLILFLFYLFAARSELKGFITSKRGRYSLNTGIMIVVFIAIMVGANYLGLTQHHRFDMTAENRFTLAPQTIRVIKNLKEPVEVIGFFPNDSQYQELKSEVRHLLEEYRYYNRKFQFRFVDPELDPLLAREFGVTRHGTIVFSSGTRRKLVQQANEQSFTGALLEVTGVEAKKVFFLIGHGERDIRSQRSDGYSLAGMGLISELYKVSTLNLTLTPEVPKDCAVLIIAGVKNALPSREKKAIVDYLKRQGKVFFLVDPDNLSKDILDILHPWGISLAPGRIIDKASYAAPEMSTPAVFKGKYPPVVISSGLDTTYFPKATAVVLTNELERVIYADEKSQSEPKWPASPVQHPNLAILPIVLSTNQSWLEFNENALSEKTKELKGPLAIGAMLIASSQLADDNPETIKEGKLTRIVVMGDSDFASNANFRNGGNGDLFLNSVNWLAEEENLISIRPKQYSFRRLLVGKDTERFIRYSSVGLLPILILMLGAIIWWRRR